MVILGVLVINAVGDAVILGVDVIVCDAVLDGVLLLVPVSVPLLVTVLDGVIVTVPV